MESEIEHLPSNSFDKEHLKKQIEIIKHASDMAQDKIDYFSSHDVDILLAISIVETFLRKKHRICYGGQAINAYLPAKHKFYDPEYSIPDYDFFTPTQHQDLKQIAEDLYKAGFTEISAREGMHEGTIKIYVNFIPVADLTSIDPKIYRILSKRESRIDGISYIDPNSLRMLMYLELSRPRGEVRRWEKVFERLVLFNEFVPVKTCKTISDKKLTKSTLTIKQAQFILRYVIQQRRIIAGADLISFYDQSVKKKNIPLNWILGSTKPIIFFSPEPTSDANDLIAELSSISSSPIKTKVFRNQGLDVIPSIHVLHRQDVPLVFIIEQSACHAYINIPIKDGTTIGNGLINKILRIASMDTLITLFFTFGFVQNKFFDRGSMDCMANQLVDLSIRARRTPESFVFPFVSIRCAGHQLSIASLIRAKLYRMTVKKKGEIRNILKGAEDKYKKRSDVRRTIRNKNN
jgi:Poly(A) polymerase catalytic subunit